ncbi:MAG: hypothetical protein ACREEU_04340 [Acetobacteraceae bacterium]
MVDPVRISSRVRRRECLIPSGGRTLTQVEAGALADLRREIARQEDVGCKRQARIHRKRARRRATFVMPHPGGGQDARIARAKLMGRR